MLVFAALVLAVSAPLASARPAQPDRGFGNRGTVHTLPGSETSGYALAALTSGRIVGVGGSRRGFGESFAVFRTSPRGRRESHVFVSFPEAPFAAATAMTIGTGGRILAAGMARDRLGRERIAIAATDELDERIDYYSYALLAAFRG